MTTTANTTQRLLTQIHVGDAMHDGVLTCDRDASLAEVARVMAERSIHCVVVANDGGTEGPYWGIVSDLDLVAAATVRELDEQTAAGTAASPVVMVTPTETLERAAQLMTEHSTSHLVVVDRERQAPVGVISTLDIAAALADGG
jgi:CBS domain-containing protein